MSTIAIRPDLKTAGGEVGDVMLNGRYVGGISLVYREGGRMSGSIQLEQSSLSSGDKHKVIRYLQEYVNSLAAALDVSEVDVVVTYSRFDQVIATDAEAGAVDYEIQDEDLAWEDFDADHVDYDSNLSDIEPDRAADTYEMYQTEDEDDEQPYAERYELVITGEHDNSIEYHIYGTNRKWLAEAFVTLYGTDCIGEINWMVEPSSEQIEHVVDLLVSDFDDDVVDSFQLEVKHNGELIEVYELDHRELADYEEQIADERSRADYSVHLVRDDGDTLTYDIFAGSGGVLPIGTATIDISRRKLTGYMDFREMNSEEEREQIAAMLLRELDKEKEFDSFNLTVLYKNRPIDELLFENMPVH